MKQIYLMTFNMNSKFTKFSNYIIISNITSLSVSENFFPKLCKKDSLKFENTHFPFAAI